ncbi:hypothetical protein E2C01_072032 [Portunus trituberculatus]|uniref:Uncharacterized protein n=1 Tax=Portunus trituberculatus TaxID=210409 RepID=A0A5B7I632_PORTR|nr:hypothetical protein [Portunus trituberculatus]
MAHSGAGRVPDRMPLHVDGWCWCPMDGRCLGRMLSSCLPVYLSNVLDTGRRSTHTHTHQKPRCHRSGVAEEDSREVCLFPAPHTFIYRGAALLPKIATERRRKERCLQEEGAARRGAETRVPRRAEGGRG